MFNYTQISNVSYVDPKNAGAPRLWAHFILIDNPKTAGAQRSPLDEIRQIRGFTNGGIGVFTYWIKLDVDVKIHNMKDDEYFVLNEDQKPLKINNNIRIVAGDLDLSVCLKDYNQPMDIKQIEVDSCPYGSDVDREILKYHNAPNYCIPVCVPTSSAIYSTKFWG